MTKLFSLCLCLLLFIVSSDAQEFSYEVDVPFSSSAITIAPVYGSIDTIKVRIDGFVNGFFGDVVTIERTSDFITGNKIFLKQIYLNEERKFCEDLIIRDLSEIHFTIGRFCYSIWVFPNEHYSITFDKGRVLFDKETNKGIDLTTIDTFCKVEEEKILSDKHFTAQSFIDFKKQLVYRNKSNSRIVDDYARFCAVNMELKLMKNSNVTDDNKLLHFKTSVFEQEAMQYLIRPYVTSFKLFLEIVWSKHPSGMSGGLEQTLRENYVIENSNLHKWEKIVAIYIVKFEIVDNAILHDLAKKQLDLLSKKSENLYYSKIVEYLQ